MPRLNFVIEKENVKADEGGKKALIELAEGDMRRVLNVLQSTHLAFGEVTEENVYQCCGQPLKSDMKKIAKWLVEGDVSSNFRRKGLSFFYLTNRI